jgi:serine/threonine-protein kinase
LDKVGRYEIEEQLAEGGMGVVYSARDPLMKRRVALKLLKPDYSRDATLRGRFLSEAEAVARLEHPCIVPVYDFGEHDDQLFFVMRFLPGGTLFDRLAGGEPLAGRELAPVLERVASALDAAHSAGIVHRDIKPANILFDSDGAAYLSDFGIAKGGQREGDTTGALVVGTPRYMSPEQAQAVEAIDGRSDIYSLGAVAFHALAGRPPFEGTTAVALALQHVSEAPPSILEFVPSLPRVADRVFGRVLAKRPTDRYATATAFARDLADIAAGRWYLIEIADPPPAPPIEEAIAPDDTLRIRAARAPVAPLPTPPDTVPIVDQTLDDSQLDDTGIFEPGLHPHDVPSRKG